MSRLPNGKMKCPRCAGIFTPREDTIVWCNECRRELKEMRTGEITTDRINDENDRGGENVPQE
jgi:uncharacterized C2H2 Zn-finger protein